MGRRIAIWSIGILAVAAWVGLFALMNMRPPTATNQALFVLNLGIAVGATAAVYFFLVGHEPMRARGPGRLGCALRRGALSGLLAAVLIALRFMRFLTLLPAVLLVLLTATMDVALSLRHR